MITDEAWDRLVRKEVPFSNLCKGCLFLSTDKKHGGYCSLTIENKQKHSCVSWSCKENKATSYIWITKEQQ